MILAQGSHKIKLDYNKVYNNYLLFLDNYRKQTFKY